MSSNINPIGIFDSGIGGLTVASAINKLLPNESIVYVGDTAHLPYGDKSPELIEQYAKRITDYLIERNCKIIVIACNTASAHAYKPIKVYVDNKLLVSNVIDPAAKAISKTFNNKKVGVIGTRGTINSGIYPRKIKKLNADIEVTSLATPLLAPMIEEGFFNNKISKTIINSYLDKKSLKGIDAIILACTHYPLIRKEIDEFYKGSAVVFDSAEMVAQDVKEKLNNANLLNSDFDSKLEFYVTDYTETFEKSARYFFPTKIHLERLALWENK
jgi:glutamate racemase